jgi:hypothetical protein
MRIWNEVDIGEIRRNLLIAGSTVGDCGNCKETGISFEATHCSKCQTAFKYMASRVSDSTKEARRLLAKRPDLMLVELKDYKEAQARTRAHGLLGD